MKEVFSASSYPELPVSAVTTGGRKKEPREFGNVSQGVQSHPEREVM